MVKAVLFDLFETLVTESRTRPAGVSSLAPDLGCEPTAFRRQWKALRPAVQIGRLSFGQALRDITTTLGSHADDAAIERICDERVRAKRGPFAQAEQPIVTMLDHLRSRNVRLGIVSNCFAEDVAAWSQCALAPYFECTVFSFEAGVAKPDPESIWRPPGVWGLQRRPPGSSATVHRRNCRVRSGRSSRVQSTLVPETLAALQGRAVVRPRASRASTTSWRSWNNRSGRSILSSRPAPEPIGVSGPRHPESVRDSRNKRYALL